MKLSLKFEGCAMEAINLYGRDFLLVESQVFKEN